MNVLIVKMNYKSLVTVFYISKSYKIARGIHKLVVTDFNVLEVYGRGHHLMRFGKKYGAMLIKWVEIRLKGLVLFL